MFFRIFFEIQSNLEERETNIKKTIQQVTIIQQENIFNGKYCNYVDHNFTYYARAHQKSMMKNKKAHVKCPNWIKQIYKEYVEEKKNKRKKSWESIEWTKQKLKRVMDEYKKIGYNWKEIKNIQQVLNKEKEFKDLSCCDLRFQILHINEILDPSDLEHYNNHIVQKQEETKKKIESLKKRHFQKSPVKIIHVFSHVFYFVIKSMFSTFEYRSYRITHRCNPKKDLFKDFRDVKIYKDMLKICQNSSLTIGEKREKLITKKNIEDILESCKKSNIIIPEKIINLLKSMYKINEYITENKIIDNNLKKNVEKFALFFSLWECDSSYCTVAEKNKDALQNFIEVIKDLLNDGKKIMINEFSSHPIDALESTKGKWKVGGNSIKDILTSMTDKIMENKIIDTNTKTAHNIKIDVKFAKNNYIFFNTSVNRVKPTKLNLNEIADIKLVMDNFPILIVNPFTDKEIKLDKEESVFTFLEYFNQFFIGKQDPHYNLIYNKPILFNTLFKTAIAIIFLFLHHFSIIQNPHLNFINSITFDSKYSDIHKNFITFMFQEIKLNVKDYKKNKLTFNIYGKFKYIFALMPFIKRCNLESFEINCSGFYDNIVALQNEEEQLFTLLNDFCNKLNLKIHLYSLETLLASIAPNYPVIEVEEEKPFKDLIIEQEQNYHKDFLVFKTPKEIKFKKARSWAKAKEILTVEDLQINNYNLKSILLKYDCLIFNNQEIIDYNFEFITMYNTNTNTNTNVDGLDADVNIEQEQQQIRLQKVINRNINEIVANELLKKNDSFMYLIYEKNVIPIPIREPEPVNNFINPNFFFLLPMIQELSIKANFEEVSSPSNSFFAKNSFLHNIFLHKKLPIVSKNLQELYLLLEIDPISSLEQVLNSLSKIEEKASCAFKKNNLHRKKITDININAFKNYLEDINVGDFVIFSLYGKNQEIHFDLTNFLNKEFVGEARILSVMIKNFKKEISELFFFNFEGEVSKKICMFKNNNINFIEKQKSRKFPKNIFILVRK
jgi:hypothetical protein